MEEREGELGRAAEAEEELHQEVPREPDAPPERIWSGDSAGWKGLWCARRRRASSSATGDWATGGSARRWGVDGVSVMVVHSWRMAAARLKAARAGGGME